MFMMSPGNSLILESKGQGHESQICVSLQTAQYCIFQVSMFYAVKVMVMGKFQKFACI